MKNKIWTSSTTAHLPITPIAEETTKALNDFLDKTWSIYKLTNTDMKQVTMTLETARGLYKDATPEMKKWLEENFKKKELVDDYTTKPLNDVLLKYGLTFSYTTKYRSLMGKIRNDINLRILMQDYYDQTGWKVNFRQKHNIFFVFHYNSDANEFNIDAFYRSIYSPFMFKTEQHAQKFIDAYKDLLLEYLNAK